MKVDGKEFLRNVGLEQDKERLTQEQRRLEELKRASVKSEQSYVNTNMQANENDSVFVDLSNQNDPSHDTVSNDVQDIMLNTSDTVNNKKKYIMLGFGLVLLFIITVLVIRLISNSDTQNQLSSTNVEQTEITKDDILNKIDSNEEYQQVIDRKKKIIESNAITQKNEENLNDLEIPQQESADNVPLVLDMPKANTEPKRDLFGLDKETQKTVDAILKKEVKVVSQPKREIILPPAKETNFTKETKSIDGYFIQIGAFTKDPNKALLKNIVAKGYTYKIHPVTVKGTVYNKVLIGSYKTRADASKQLGQVKIDFKNPNAYVLKF